MEIIDEEPKKELSKLRAGDVIKTIYANTVLYFMVEEFTFKNGPSFAFGTVK